MVMQVFVVVAAVVFDRVKQASVAAADMVRLVFVGTALVDMGMMVSVAVDPVGKVRLQVFAGH
jgi:hypothetical protein